MLEGVGWGDDCREKGRAEGAGALLGVNRAAIVLVCVGSELVRDVRHGGLVLLAILRVFMLLGVSELEFLR